MLPDTTCSQGGGRDAAGRFLPGQSGNPGGRPARLTAWREAVDEAVTVDDVRRVLRALLDAAAGGDVSAARLVLEYTLGKPTTPIDVSTGYIERFKAIDKSAFDLV